TLYELATLRTAFAGRSGKAVIRAILEDSLTPPSQLSPSIPRDLETIILTATERDPARRYTSASALRDDLRRFIEDMPIEARRISYIERLGRWARRNPALAGATALAFALLLTVALVFSVAYVRVKQAEIQTAAALGGETRQRERAEATLAVAVRALDKVFDEFAPLPSVAGDAGSDDESSELVAPVGDTPSLTPETAVLLKSLLGFYQRLAEQEGGSSALQRKTASTQRRVGEIQERLGQFDEATIAYEQAIERYRALLDNSHDDVQSRIGLADSYNQLGQLFNRQGQ